ncbi:MAG: nucleotide exchange factor GrpE [Bacteroidetes bacterium GWF2_29_10]|nr:MAG: nucleotide exchange factor GrpE [Bacteroidetes bacterium GWF2_29_10]
MLSNFKINLKNIRKAMNKENIVENDISTHESEDVNEVANENNNIIEDEITSESYELIINDLKQKNEELQEKFLRLFSEFDNYKRRTAKEKMDIMNIAGENIIKSLINILDDFERAEKSINSSANIEAVMEGLNLITNKFKDFLSQNGVEPINSIGMPLDTDMHEAITQSPAPSEDMKGKVINEVQKGYLMNGKVIRFSKVIIGN